MQQGFFSVHYFLEPPGQHCIGYLCLQCCPRSIKKTLIRIFRVLCWLESLGQNCIRFLPVLYCPKGIKTTLIRIFFFLCNIVWSLLDNIAQGLHLFNTFAVKPAVWDMSGSLFFNKVKHHRTILALFVQCWLGSSFTACGTTMNRDRVWLEQINTCNWDSFYI